MKNDILIGLLAPLGVVAIIVGSVFAAWLLILASPVLLAVGVVGFCSTRQRMPKAVKDKEVGAPKKKTADNLEILCIKGLQTEPALEEQFRTGLAELWAQAPEEHAVVCSCVRKHRNGYYGVFRMRSDHGHSYARVVGGSVGDIGEQYLKQLKTYKRKLPIRMTATPFESGECNRKRCHLKEKSIFQNGATLVA
jgi:hypothetical protein